MEDEDWMEVVNVDKLINFSRKIIYQNFDRANDALDDLAFIDKVKAMRVKDNPELNRILPYKEAYLIFSEYLITQEDDGKLRYYIKNDDYDTYLNKLNERMVSNIVQNLVSKGYVETAFDNEKNDFVFWVNKEVFEDGDFPTDDI